MKINWKVRLKNPIFWITCAPTVIAAVYAILSACGITPSISENQVVDWVMGGVSALATLGVLVDPTTKGASDSEQALTYEYPKES